MCHNNNNWFQFVVTLYCNFIISGTWIPKSKAFLLDLSAWHIICMEHDLLDSNKRTLGWWVIGLQRGILLRCNQGQCAQLILSAHLSNVKIKGNLWGNQYLYKETSRCLSIWAVTRGGVYTDVRMQGGSSWRKILCPHYRRLCLPSTCGTASPASELKPTCSSRNRRPSRSVSWSHSYWPKHTCPTRGVSSPN